MSTIVFLDEIKWTATRRASPLVIDYLRTAHGTDIVCHTTPAFLSGEKIKKCAAQSCAPKNTALIAATQLFYNPKRYAKKGHVFLPCKNAHHFGHSIKLCRKAIVSCVLENSNSLRNQADMTIAHEKTSPEQQRIRCAVRAVGDGMKSSNFCFINFNGIEKAKRPSPTSHRGQALRLFYRDVVKPLQVFMEPSC